MERYNMRHKILLAASLTLWTAPALASHIVPQTFATTPADPPTAAVSTTASAHQGPSVFPFYTPMPSGPAHTDTAQNVTAGDPLNPQMNPHDMKNTHR